MGESESSSNTNNNINKIDNNSGGRQKPEGGKAAHSLGQLLRNLTTTSPFFVYVFS